MFAVDWKILVAVRYLLFLLPRETRIAGVIAAELTSDVWTPFDKPPTGFEMKPLSVLFLGEFAMVSVPNLWVQGVQSPDAVCVDVP